MNLTEAKAIRARQLQGQDVDPSVVAEAIATIAAAPITTPSTRPVKNPKPQKEPRVRADAGTSPAPANPWNLTSRQYAIVSRLYDCDGSKAIAAAMGLAEITVKAHLTAAFRAMGITNRTQAAVLWDRWKRGAA